MTKKLKIKKLPRIPKKHLGSSFDLFLEELGILQECKLAAKKMLRKEYSIDLMRNNFFENTYHDISLFPFVLKVAEGELEG